MADWKKVADERLRRIKSFERRSEMLRLELVAVLQKELTIALHASCLTSVAAGEAQEKIRSVAERVAEVVMLKV